MRLHIVIVGTLLSSLFMVDASAKERQDSLDWLRTAIFASHLTDYSGVFVYQYGNNVETSRITHVVESDSEYEKLESLDGPKRLIVRHHGQVWCYINQKMEQVDSQHKRVIFPSLLPEQLAVLSENYQVQEGGVERVAEYNTQVVVFRPKDNLRYTHKIWVHTDSGLLLKAAILGSKNQLVEQYAFTQLQIGGEIDRSWVRSIALRQNLMSVPPTSANSGEAAGLPMHEAQRQPEQDPNSVTSKYHNADESAPASVRSVRVPAPLGAYIGDTAVNDGWRVDAIPPGFKKTMQIRRQMRGKHAPVVQLVYSDGLSAISIFIEPSDGEANDAGGLSGRGAVNLYHKVVDKNLYTVVGEVPPRTVIQVLNSIRRGAH